MLSNAHGARDRRVSWFTYRSDPYGSALEEHVRRRDGRKRIMQGGPSQTSAGLGFLFESDLGEVVRRGETDDSELEQVPFASFPQP